MPTAAEIIAMTAARRPKKESTTGPTRKRITDPFALMKFQKSTTYKDLLVYMQDLSAAIAGRRLSEQMSTNGCIRTILDAFDRMSGWIDEIPPNQQAQRYGNTAFRTWHGRLVEYAPQLMQSLIDSRASAPPPAAANKALPRTFIESAIPTRVAFEASLKLPDEERWQAERAAGSTTTSSSAAAAPAVASSDAPPPPPTAAAELAAYFSDSFGNVTRIDYGTGHELNFLVWLYLLERPLGLLNASDRVAVAIVIFQRYLTVMRKLQTTYWLEPAGSHGVWGLDDYQFLPFLLGAAQLIGHKEIEPKSVHDEKLLEAEADEYYYLAAVRFIKQVKKGPFGEHSPVLNDISALSDWRAVAAGLGRMYEGEVLGKFPVVQHLPFGTLLRWPEE